MSELKIVDNICPCCGGEIPKGALVCPFCGFENERIAEEQEKDRLEDLKQDHEEAIDAVQDRMVEKARRWWIPVLVVLLLAGIGVVIGVQVWSDKVAEENHQQLVRDRDELPKQMEELYEAADYEGLKKLCNESRYYGGVFEKYKHVTKIYTGLQDTKTMQKSYAFGSDKCTPENVAQVLKCAFYTLSYADSYRKEGFVYGEEKGVTELEQELISVLKDNWDITDQEILEGKNRQEEAADYASADHTDLARKLIERKTK